MSKVDYERLWYELEGSLVSRRWDAVSASWSGQAPQIEPAGGAPSITLSRYLSESGIFADSLPEKHKLTHVRNSRDEVPSLVLREAIYWLHKAVHVLGACETQVNGGRLTWASSDAYQNAYFAARAIISLLGVAIAEVENSSIVIELCRDQKGMRPGKISELGAFEEQLHILSLGILFDHRQIWTIFRRVVRTTTRLNWSPELLSYFSNIDIALLSRQRHGLHYQVDYWIMPDMHEFIHSDAFRDVSPDASGRALFSPDRNNYTFTIAFTLTRLALMMFKDLCKLTNRLSGEQELFIRTLSSERHPVFSHSLREVL